jgi:hypothetical protein
MSQNRDAPAYLEYAATILAQLPFRTMTLQDRGLLYTMKLDCWVNMRLPHSHSDLAKVLGLPVAEVAGSLASVMPFFEVVDGFIISPELENYRAHLAERKCKQSQGGKRGSAITNGKRNRPAKAAGDGVSSAQSSTSRLPRQGSDESLVQSNTEKPSQTQTSEKGIAPAVNSVGNDEWLGEYETAEGCTPEAYTKASGG